MHSGSVGKAGKQSQRMVRKWTAEEDELMAMLVGEVREEGRTDRAGAFVYFIRTVS